MWNCLYQTLSVAINTKDMSIMKKNVTARWNVGDMGRRILTIPQTSVRKSANAKTSGNHPVYARVCEKWKKRNISSKIHQNPFLLGSDKNCRYHKKRK